MGLPKKQIYDDVSGKYWASVSDCAWDMRLSPQHIRYIIKNKGGCYTDKNGLEHRFEYTDHVPEKTHPETHPIEKYPRVIQEEWDKLRKHETNIYYSNIQELAYKMAARMAELGVTGMSYVEVDEDFYFGKDD